MATNQILPFCPTDTGTNLLTQSDYSAATDRTIGNQPGIASSKLNNKAIRQSAFIASQFAQYVSNTTGQNILDDGNTTNLLNTITSAFSIPDNARYIANLGLSASVATNALTISLKTKAGTSPSSTDIVKIAFRDSTSTNGIYSVQSVSSALSIVVPASATLGQVSGVNQYVWVYAIYDGATVQLGVSGVNVFSDLSIQTSTTISSGATSGTVLYSTSGVSSKSIRLIGRFLVNEVTAGTWALAPTEVSLQPTPTITTTDWISGGTNTITAVSANPTKGTTSTDQVQYRRYGGMGFFNPSLFQTGAGSAGTGDYLFLLPGSLSFDTAKAPLYTGSTLQDAVTFYSLNGNFGCSDGTNYIQGQAVPYDATHYRLIGINTISNLRTMSSTNNPLSNAAQKFSGWFWAPVLGWSSYGP